VPVIERNLADEQIQRAAKVAQEITDHNLANIAQVVVHCTEALVRQIRDADDTIATQLIPALSDGMGDLTINVTGAADAITNAIANASPKKGLF
jgi:hypothetical protein